MARTARRVARRSNGTDPLVTHAVAIGISGTAGLAFGLKMCGRIIDLLAASEHWLIWAGVAFIITWLAVCLVRAIAHGLMHVWQEQQAKRYYRSLGYELTDGVLTLHGEPVQ